MDTLSLAKKHFGIASFRGDQEHIINASLDNKDLLVVQGTGFGKSLCFQLPALIRTGITLVISPLVALMDDQVSHLMEKGIWATAIHRNLDRDETQHRLDLLHLHQYHLLYLSPEKLASTKFLAELSLLPISHLVVDEAHCISEWGHQFRPDYRNIAAVRPYFKQRITISAFTATAPTWVKQDILKMLEIPNATVFGGSILRSNISLFTRYCELETDKWQHVVEELAVFARRTTDSEATFSIIIYVLTRQDSEQLSEIINELWPIRGTTPFAAAYHAGLDPLVRQSLQQAFQHGKIPCIVATNAFGMGVDKSNVRLVVLYGAPASPESLLQQVGRAGRDGEPSRSVILFSQRDFTVHQQLQSPYTGMILELLQHRLKKVAELLTKNQCRWQSLAKYYDEHVTECAQCDTCRQKNSDLTHSPDVLSSMKFADTISSAVVVKQNHTDQSLSSRQSTLYNLISNTFPQASVTCIPGLGKGIITYESNHQVR